MTRTPEGLIQAKIIKFLKEHHILHRRYNAVSSAFGYPDIDVWYAGTYIGLEVKTPNGVSTDLQRRMQEAINSTGNHYHFVTSVEDVRNILNGIKTLPKPNT